MQTLQPEVYERNMEATRIALRDSILSINIWDKSTGLTLAEWNGNPTGVAFLTQLVTELEATLANSNLDNFKDYIYFDLEDHQALVVIDHGDDLLQGWLIDGAKANPAILLGMAIPNAIANIGAAKQHADKI